MVINNGIKSGFLHMKTVDIEHGGSDIYRRSDDDTNYTVTALAIMDRYGRTFSSDDVAQTWVERLPGFALATAERVAYRNILLGKLPPLSATHLNPFREWIGAQIRADFYGYVNPGNPELAAEYAFRDASVSHVKNGLYGAMFIAAMIAAAAVCNSMELVISAGLEQIPQNSRTAEGIRYVMRWKEDGESWKQVIDRIHARYDEKNFHNWCHTVPNAMIVVAALLYGDGDLTKTIFNAVLAGMDTDCNAASAASVVGMLLGAKALPQNWIDPLNNRMLTNVSGYQDVQISDLAKQTITLI